MCLCSLHRWQRPFRRSSLLGLADLHAGIVYILSISMGTGGGIDGGMEVHIFIGEGDHRVVSIWWLFREVRIAWCAHTDLVQASQFLGLS